MANDSKARTITSWILQVVVAFILGQTLFFKFTGAEETKALFDVLGQEPLGRYGSGVLELIAVILLLVPRTPALGALVSLAVIVPAIFFHFTKLGISIDPVALGNPALEPLAGPTLFAMAAVVFICSAAILWLRREEIPLIGKSKS